MAFKTGPTQDPVPVDERREQARQSVPPVESSCPTCQAVPGEPCTKQTRSTRRVVKFFHYARLLAARNGGLP